MKPELINQGSYGCIYKPGIKCNIEDEEIKENYISKVQINNKFAKKELLISKKIVEKIKNYDRYFSPLINFCDRDLDIKMVGEEINKCEALKNSNGEIDKEEGIILNTLKYAGDKTLYDVLMETKGNKRVYIRECLDTLIKLLESIEKLNEIGIIHMDIKAINVLYGKNKARPIIIDFGLSCDLDNLEKEEIFFTYGYDYVPWCIDITMITYIVENKLEKRNITEESYKEHIIKVCDDFTNNNGSALEKEKLNEKIKKYFEKYIGKKYEEMYEDLLKKAKTWDNHSIIIMYYELIKQVFGEEEELKIILEKMKNQILSTPEERKTTDVIIKELKEEIKEINKEKLEKDISKKEINEKMLYDIGLRNINSKRILMNMN